MNTDGKIRFDAMGLSPEILEGLKDLQFEVPTPIQSQVIPTLLKSSNDLLGFAQTGTGKTAAFSLPILQQVDTKQGHVQALILCPTRELCMQITKDITHFAKHLPEIKTVAVYGGDSMYLQIKKITQGAQIVVGTPGRIKDLSNRGKLILNKVRWLVLDEADDMLDKGFKEDLDAILDTTPDGKQTLLFSATMSPWIQKVAQKRMHNPKEIRVSAQNQGAETVEHHYVTVHAKDRYPALRRLLDVNPDVYGIVFCRTRNETKTVAAKLIADQYSAQAIHGDISQDERTETMTRFRQKDIQILVATDVAARGIDVNDLTHVINYELPDSPETYLHRSGRTGRAGKMGICLTIIHMKEHGKLKRIESIMKQKFNPIQVPTGKAICEAQLMSLVNRVKKTHVDHENLKPYLPAIHQLLGGLTQDEIIQRFVSVEFNHFLKHYSNVRDIAAEQIAEREKFIGAYKSEKNRGNIEFKVYQINFGRIDGFNPKALFEIINRNQSLKGIEIGNIRVQPQQTQFEADARYHEKVIRFLGREMYRKKHVKVVSL